MPAHKRSKKKSRKKKSKSRGDKAWPAIVIAILVTAGLISYVSLFSQGIGQFTRRDQAQVGCSEDAELTDTSTNVALSAPSADYQKFLRELPAKSRNLVQNASLMQLNNETQSPTGFFRTVESSWAHYSIEEPFENTAFLRATSGREVGDNEVAAGWIMKEVPVSEGGTYVYSFNYRSSAPVDVSLQYIMPSGKSIYEHVATLEKQDSWQQFTTYTTNTRGAKALRFAVASREIGQVDTRGYDIHQVADARLDRGVVSIAFDDGWQSIYDKALPLLEAHNLRTTQYIISHVSETDTSGYMGMDTVRKLKDGGHEIGSHTLSHCDQTKLSEAEIQENAKDSKAALEAQELGPITSLAYPYGQHNETTRRLMGQEYTYLRSSDSGYNDRLFDARNIRSMGILDTTSDRQFRAWLDYAAKHRVWLVLVYHRIDEQGTYSITSTQLEKQLDMIKASKLPVLPLSEAAETIR